MRRARSLLWVCAVSGSSSHVAVLTHRAAKLKTLVTLDLPDIKVTKNSFFQSLLLVLVLIGTYRRRYDTSYYFVFEIFFFFCVTTVFQLM